MLKQYDIRIDAMMFESSPAWKLFYDYTYPTETKESRASCEHSVYKQADWFDGDKASVTTNMMPRHDHFRSVR